MTGPLTVASEYLMVQDGTAEGYVKLNSGDASDPGYIEFGPAGGLRAGYIGWTSDVPGWLAMEVENGWAGYRVQGGLSVRDPAYLDSNTTIGGAASVGGQLTVTGGNAIVHRPGDASVAVWTDGVGGTTAYAAGMLASPNGSLYFAQMNGDGSYYDWLGRFDLSGNLWTRSAVTASYIHSTGNAGVDADLSTNRIFVNWDSYLHSTYVQGGLGLRFSEIFGRSWVAFGDWDGSNLGLVVDGGYVGQIAGTNWVVNWVNGHYFPNQNVDWGSGPTFGYIHNTGTIDNDGEVHVGGLCRSGDDQTYGNYNSLNRGWLWIGNIDCSNSCSVGGPINCGDVRVGSCNGVLYNCYGHWFSFWYSGGSGWCYARLDGSWDVGMGTISDERYKQDIAPSEVDCLGVVRRIPLYQFRFMDFAPKQESDDVPFEENTHPHVSRAAPPKPAKPDTPLQTVGFIAQRMHEVFPEAAYGDGEDFLSWGVHTDKVLALLVGAVQQLADILESR
jgi:hypothetical protein